MQTLFREVQRRLAPSYERLLLPREHAYLPESITRIREAFSSSIPIVLDMHGVLTNQESSVINPNAADLVNQLKFGLEAPLVLWTAGNRAELSLLHRFGVPLDLFSLTICRPQFDLDEYRQSQLADMVMHGLYMPPTVNRDRFVRNGIYSLNPKLLSLLFPCGALWIEDGSLDFLSSFTGEANGTKYYPIIPVQTFSVDGEYGGHLPIFGPEITQRVADAYGQVRRLNGWV